MHIGSVLLAIWLVIGGLAAGQRGDFKGSIGCGRAGTIAVTVLAGPLNYAGVNPHIKCSTAQPSSLSSPCHPRGLAQGVLLVTEAPRPYAAPVSAEIKDLTEF